MVYGIAPLSGILREYSLSFTVTDVEFIRPFLKSTATPVSRDSRWAWLLIARLTLISLCDRPGRKWVEMMRARGTNLSYMARYTFAAWAQ